MYVYLSNNPKDILMKKIQLMALATFALVLTSCGDTKKEPVNAPEPQVEATATNTAAVPETPATTNTDALNPEHGQPGHRCDIPVGAPLNTPAGGNQANMPTQATTAPQGNQPFLVNDDAKQRLGGATPTATSGNLNPAHGQPGHRCDIPVGQPLS